MHPPVNGAGKTGLLAGGRRCGRGHKEEVVSPEEHLDAADHGATPPGEGAGPVPAVVGHRAEGGGGGGGRGGGGGGRHFSFTCLGLNCMLCNLCISISLHAQPVTTAAVNSS